MFAKHLIVAYKYGKIIVLAITKLVVEF